MVEEEDAHCVKPMSALRVCPTFEEDDDIAESVSSFLASSPPPVPATSPVRTVQPELKRDPLAIRHQYMTQLGINLSARAFERTSKRPRTQPIGFKVKLKAPARHRSENRSVSFFKAIAEWYTASSNKDDDEEESNTSSDIEDDIESVSSSRVGFIEEAEMFLIPVHHEYSERERNDVWHTREEFMTMVEKNLDEMYDEMDREYELQVAQETEENELMMLEEERQRQAEKELLQQRSSTPFHLSPSRTRIQVARTPHEIRATYLKNLGIKHGKHVACLSQIRS